MNRLHPATFTHFPFLQSAIIRWLITLSYTGLLILLLVQPSGHPVVGPAAPPGDPTPPRELLLTIGHMVSFSLLTALWWWSSNRVLSFRQALITAVIVAIVIGLFTEWAQAAVPDRNASVFDMGVNLVASLVTAWVISSANGKWAGKTKSSARE